MFSFMGMITESKKGFSSGSLELAEAVNKNKNITVDVGQVMFKPTLTISFHLMWNNSELEITQTQKNGVINEIEDGGGGIIPYEYKKKNFVNSFNG